MPTSAEPVLLSHTGSENTTTQSNIPDAVEAILNLTPADIEALFPSYKTFLRELGKALREKAVSDE